MAGGPHASSSPTISRSDIGDLAQVQDCSRPCHPPFGEASLLSPLSLTLPPAQRHTHPSGTSYPRRRLARSPIPIPISIPTPVPIPVPIPFLAARPYYYPVWSPSWRVGPFLLLPPRLMLSHPNVAVPTLTCPPSTQPPSHALVSPPVCTRPHLLPQDYCCIDAGHGSGELWHPSLPERLLVTQLALKTSHPLPNETTPARRFSLKDFPPGPI
jgi:hypothetical protein